MIIASGALVLGALVLLVAGLVLPSLALVYGSIAASLLAFGFLLGGVLARRTEPVAGDGSAAPPAAGPAAEARQAGEPDR